MPFDSAHFDPLQYQLHLAAARKSARIKQDKATKEKPWGTTNVEQARVNVGLVSGTPRPSGTTVFDESKHPRGFGGKWIGKGASGAAVTAVQARLGGGLATDSQFGPKTEAAVRKYQKEHKLKVDGLVGAQTAAALLGQGAKKPGALTAWQIEQLQGFKPQAPKPKQPKPKKAK